MSSASRPIRLPLVWVLSLGLSCAGGGWAQKPGTSTTAICRSDPQLPAFEVAAITPVAEKDRGTTIIGQYGQPHFAIRGASLALLLTFAFDVQPANFVDAPHGVENAVFDVQVQSADGVLLTYEALKPRLQQMLEQRFCLLAHTGTKQVAGYELIVARGGAKITPVRPEGERGSGQITDHKVSGSRMDMAEFASMLGSAIGRPIRDATEIAGLYTMSVQFAPRRRTRTRACRQSSRR